MDKAKRKAEDDHLSPEQAKAKKAAIADEDEDTGDENLEDDSIRAAEAASPMSKGAAFSPEGGDGEDDDDSKDEDSDLAVQLGEPDKGDMDDPKQVKGKAKKKKKGVKEESEEAVEAPTAEPEAEDTTAPLDKSEFLDALKDMDELLSNMSPETEESEVDSAETDETEA